MYHLFIFLSYHDGTWIQGLHMPVNILPLNYILILFLNFNY